MKKREFPNLPLMVEGMAIGIANAVPGVSGGTIAVVVGIYDRVISAVSGFFSNEYGWKRNLLFLVQLAIGLLAGLIGFANILDWLIEFYPYETQFGFIGLILGSVPFLVKLAEVPKLKLRHWVVFLVFLGIMIFVGLQERPPASEPLREFSFQSALTVFGAGIISSATMVIPGISGSFVLLLLQLYSTFITAITELNLPLLGIFILGSILGIILVSKAIHWVLSRYHSLAYAAIIGLVIGSVVMLFPRDVNYAFTLWQALSFLLAFGVAFLLSGERKMKHQTSTGGRE